MVRKFLATTLLAIAGIAAAVPAMAAGVQGGMLTIHYGAPGHGWRAPAYYPAPVYRVPAPLYVPPARYYPPPAAYYPPMVPPYHAAPVAPARAP